MERIQLDQRKTMLKRTYKIGIVGTGFIARGLMNVLTQSYSGRLAVSRVLTRRDFAIDDLPLDRSLLTSDVEDVIKASDLVVISTGDAIHGAAAAEKILKAGLPIVTMDAELQLTCGTELSKLGRFVEAEGDQPGVLAALVEDARAMGFRPLVYGNVKGFLNLNPAFADMGYWAKKQGQRLQQVVAMTDGTKVQIEQALVANAFGAKIVGRGLSAIPCKNIGEGALRLARMSEEMSQPISDYIVCAGDTGSVFMVSTYEGSHQSALQYMKLGPGPHYLLTRPFHLCYLEIPKTILRVLEHRDWDFNNGRAPSAQVVAVAKQKLQAGSKIAAALGSFEFRGEAVRIADYPGAVPICLLQNAVLKRDLDEGQIVDFKDVSLPESRALAMWQKTVRETVAEREVEPVRVR